MDKFFILREEFDHLKLTLNSVLNELIELRRIKESGLKEKWLENNDLSELLGVSKRTLLKHRENGILPYSKVDGKIYYKASDVEALLNNNYELKSKRNGDSR